MSEHLAIVQKPVRLHFTTDSASKSCWKPALNLPKGFYVVPFWGRIPESESPIPSPKRNYIVAAVHGVVFQVGRAVGEEIYDAPIPEKVAWIRGVEV